jgi:hypothetical protein
MTTMQKKATSRTPRQFKVQVVQRPGYETQYYVPRSERFPDADAAKTEVLRRMKRDLLPEAVAGSQSFTLTPEIVGGRVRYTERWWKVDVVIRARHAFTVDVSETTEKRAIAHARRMMPDRPTQIGIWTLFSRKTPFTEVQALAA